MFRLCISNYSLICRRNFALTAKRRSKDPLYEIFLEKVREYREKSPKGKPLDAGPEYEKELNETLEKLAVKFGGGEGVDMLEFPKFKEAEVKLDPLSVLVDPKKSSEKDSKKKPKSGAKESEKKTTSKDQQKTKDTKAEAKDAKGKAKDEAKGKAKDEAKAKAKDEAKAKAKDEVKAEAKPKDDKKKK